VLKAAPAVEDGWAKRCGGRRRRRALQRSRTLRVRLFMKVSMGGMARESNAREVTWGRIESHGANDLQ
jgi:hypothetical protein